MSIRKSIINTCLAALALATIPLACDQNDEGDRSVTPRDGGYSGQELYLAIFFGQGEAAQLLPTMWGDCDNQARKDAIARLGEDELAAALDEAIAEADAQGASGVASALQRVRENPRDYTAGGHPAEGVNFDGLIAIIESRDPEFFDRFARDIQSGDHVTVSRGLEDARAVTDLVWDEVQFPGVPDENGILLAYDYAFVYDTLVAWEKFWVKTDFEMDSVIYEEMIVEEIVGGFGL